MTCFDTILGCDEHALHPIHFHMNDNWSCSLHLDRNIYKLTSRFILIINRPVGLNDYGENQNWL
jgi:hypothetical protein